MIRDLGFEILGAVGGDVIKSASREIALKTRDERLAPAIERPNGSAERAV
jgi:hypothetical protein